MKYELLVYVQPGSTFKNSISRSHHALKFFGWISERRAIVSQHSIKH